MHTTRADMRGRPKAQLVLSESEREQLTALTLRRKTSQALALRARIVLACAAVIAVVAIGLMSLSVLA